jgi:hypothetical protein
MKPKHMVCYSLTGPLGRPHTSYHEAQEQKRNCSIQEPRKEGLNIRRLWAIGPGSGERWWSRLVALLCFFVRPKPYCLFASLIPYLLLSSYATPSVSHGAAASWIALHSPISDDCLGLANVLFAVTMLQAQASVLWRSGLACDTWVPNLPLPWRE